ncbi:MAG: hypothetical protein EOO50_08980 [Flavobacterium sp.]|uniref:hypothetical protein n=1 Tax=Flavobacterium sp. TaxID=239 RepID=UPI001212BC68|nr:hypothetical protein [Flavobacterium sp.]RZJ66649.1 MAG: hypothetical protein EOO50_08980 [Flavobacterium sp.]
MKNLIILFALFFVFRCQKKQTFDEGIYILKNYVEKENYKDDYAEKYLAKVSKNEITYYGTVKTWGTISKRNFEDEKNRIVNDSTIRLETFINIDTHEGEFIKINASEKIIGPKGIDVKALSDYLNRKLIAGTYKYGDVKVIFTPNGRIENFGKLKTFSVRPRVGTLWNYDSRTMLINGEAWKYGFTKSELVLTRYSNRRDENEAFVLSDSVIGLKRQIR